MDINDFEKDGEYIYKTDNVKIFASESIMKSMLRDKTIEQATNVSELPGIVGESLVMPDGHQGYGFPIGGVAAFDYDSGLLSPGGIGFDINCGVRVLRTNMKYNEIKDKIVNLTNELFSAVPSGLGVKNRLHLNQSEMDGVLNEGVKWCSEHSMCEDDSEFIEENGSFAPADASYISDKAKKRGSSELGTLGSGNHFLEIQKVDNVFDEKAAEAYGIAKDDVTIMIHTGSRGLGHQVATDWIRKMEKDNPNRELPDRELIWDSEMQYFKAMAGAANFAWTNRQIITEQVRGALKKYGISAELIYDVAHNIAKVERYKKKVIVHRKGATRAFGPGRREVPLRYRNIGQPVIVPGSMGTSSYILKGFNAERISFGSSAHGAGRVMSRHEAVRRQTYEELVSTLKSKRIFLASRTKNGALEEAPQAYKDIDEVIRVTDALDIAKKVAKLKPLGVIKG